jgi:predicted amidohydrolase
VLFLPEASDYIAGSPQESVALARPVAKSPFVLGLQSAAKEHSLAIHVGIHVPVSVKAGTQAPTNPVIPSLPEVGSAANSPSAGREATQTKLYNRTIYINPDGSIHDPGTYDKLHLFDFPAGGLRESAHTQAGSHLVPPFDTPVGRVGSLICFDLRFPEASLRLAHPPAALAARDPRWQPAQIIAYPSAFTVPTGRSHWEVLLRARAIENQAFVLAAAQVGRHDENRVSYGHSMAVDPWGRVLCRLGGAAEDGSVEEGAAEALGLVDVNLDEWERVRRQMPLVRRTSVDSSPSLPPP